MSGENPYIPEIDGLRAFAVLAVLLFHGFPAVGVGGFIGVDIFFVISGFVISRTYLHRLADHEASLREFYLRRIRRLAPAYFVVLIATSAIAFFQLEPELLLNFGKSLVAQPFYAQNFVFWLQGDYFAGAITKPLLHTWSLAVEEQFFILLGFAILVLRKWKYLLWPILIAAFLGSILLGLFVSEISPKTSFYLLPTRIWEFALGIGVFLATRQIGRTASTVVARSIYYLCVLGLIISIFAFGEGAAFPGSQAYISPCF
jgi:peptidoglycan/LPS O-acetylase OafA/YrhL